MQLKFSNFGPIAEGELQLRPLTILVGDNQAGKSYAAMAVHAFFRAMSAGERPYFYRFQRFDTIGALRNFRQRPRVVDLSLSNLHTKLQATSMNEIVTLSPAELRSLEDYTRVGQLKATVKSSVEEVFSTKASDLLRIHQQKGSIELAADEWSISLSLSSSDVSTSFDLQHQEQIHVGYLDRRRKGFKEPEKGHLVAFKPSDQGRHSQVSTFVSELIDRVASIGDMPAFDESLLSFYVPAIRSGLLLSHRLFLSLLIRSLPRFGLEPVSIPQMTGVTADFLQSLLIGPDDRIGRPHSARMFTEFEELLTGGTVYFKRDQKEEIPSIHFKTPEGLDIPLTLASSTVSEVAPLFLLLRAVPMRDMWIIIEEPESHLSPENQVNMAKFLAAMVGRGLRVICTTHSTFLLEQINNLIAKSHSKNADSHERLLATAVAAHKVMKRKPAMGSVIEPLKVDPVEGIDLSSFVNVYQNLYEEGLRLKRRAGGE